MAGTPEAEDISVFPMAIPMIAGPGSIASIMLLTARADGLAEDATVLAALTAVLLLTLAALLAAGPLMKLIGGSSLGLGLLSGYVAVGPMRRGAPWAAAALALCIATPVVMAAYVAETLAKLTGSPTSWHIMGILLAIDAIAFGLHAFSRRGAAGS